MLDLVIKNALVIDGTGERKPFPADVGISGGKIALVGKIDREAAKTIDAAGLALLPVL